MSFRASKIERGNLDISEISDLIISPRVYISHVNNNGSVKKKNNISYKLINFSYHFKKLRLQKLTKKECWQNLFCYDNIKQSLRQKVT